VLLVVIDVGVNAGTTAEADTKFPAELDATLPPNDTPPTATMTVNASAPVILLNSASTSTAAMMITEVTM
jgi:hypothetical protein